MHCRDDFPRFSCSSQTMRFTVLSCYPGRAGGEIKRGAEPVVLATLAIQGVTESSTHLAQNGGVRA